MDYCYLSHQTYILFSSLVRVKCSQLSHTYNPPSPHHCCSTPLPSVGIVYESSDYLGALMCGLSPEISSSGVQWWRFQFLNILETSTGRPVCLYLNIVFKVHNGLINYLSFKTWFSVVAKECGTNMFSLVFSGNFLYSPMHLEFLF